MKKNLLKVLFAFLGIIIYQFANAQTWVDMMKNPDANFYETQQEFENYWANRPYEKGKGYKQFRRWEDLMAPRVFPKGDVKQANRAKDEFKIYMEQHPDLFDASRSSVWQPLGPNGAPAGGGAGRINAVRIHPTTPTTLYACSPAGGLWISTNSGTSWTTNTDQHTVIGCTDIAIDPTNTQVMYLATGDGDAGDTYSIGVLKSTDGGATWNPTGLTWAVTQGRTISKLLINPTNTQIILAATSNGVYRTTNGGTSWTQERTGNFKDMEFKPGDPTTIYACGTTFWVSTDSGNNFTQITSGVPTGVSRLAIATTDANANYVYILAANNTNSGLTGVYRSTNSGTSFTQRTGTSPNLLGWNSNGGDSGGQGWYDLAIAASPTNADVVVVGGVNIWRSTNGGTSWTINGHWTGSGGAPYVHADIHDLIFLPGSGTTIYSGNDGGVFRTTNSGPNWTDISGNLQIAQQYELGSSASNQTLLVTGHQDNGTNKMNGTVWSEIYGGDGMQCFIDRTNNNVIVASYVYGDFKRSTNGGGTWSTITSGLTGNAAWEAPIHQSPTTASTYYCGYQNMFRTTNNGTSWSAIGALPGTGTVVEFDVAPTNTQVIYALKSNGVYKTTNGGTNWTTITGTLPVGSAALTNVEISPTDPNMVWVTFSGYSTGNKVFMSTNGGTNWTNYSTGLPNLPANCIVYQTGSNDAVYVGTDVGVYYRDNSLTTWQPYFTGLPNVIVRDLEIYDPTGKIRAATYGRGTWEADLYSPGTNAPIADFTANLTSVCPGTTINFTDLSSYSPTSWSWDFGGGGTPNTSTAQNPSIVFNTPGTYTVTLVATNANGNDSEIKTGYITVTTSQALPLVEGFESATFAPTGWVVNDINANGNTFQRTTSVSGFGTSTACMIFDNYSVDEAGGRDEFISPVYDFTGYSSATMTFDVAYARYNATYFDSLYVLVSTDCGVTYTPVYLKGNTTLATAPDVTTGFVPTSTQWRTESVSMTPYLGNSSVRVKFQNRGAYGQAIYIDNINITGVPTASLPSADFSGTPTTLCAGQTVTYTNLSIGSPTSYSWSFSGGTPATSTAANPTVTYNTAGTYSVTLTATNASGSDVETKTNYITVNALPTATATSNSPICTGQTLNLSTPTVSGATYSWSGPGGYTAAIRNPSRTNATTAMSGIYTVTVTANGCSAVSNTTVVVNNAPTANAASNSPICSGSTINLTTPTVSGATYSWSGPNGFTSTSQNPTITGATTAMSGTYTVIVNNGCTANSNTTVTVNASPNANATSNSPICSGATLTLSTPSVSGATYSWSGPGGYTAAIRNPSRTNATIAMSGTYTVTVTANGCSTVSNVVVTINATPATPVITSNSPVCIGQTITFSTPTVSGATYSWSNQGVWTSTQQNPTRPNATTGMGQNYYLTVTVNGCTSGQATETVVVNPVPATPVITSNTPVCTGQTLTFTTPTVSGATYNWSNQGTWTSTQQNPTRPNATTGMGQDYYLTITVNGCTSGQATETVVVNSTPATPTASSNSPVCTGNTINLATPTVSGATYSWSGPNSFTSSSQNPNITSASGVNSGTYNVTVTVGGCTSAMGSATVSVGTPAIPSVTVSQNIGTNPSCIGDLGEFIAVPTNGGATPSYQWQINGFNVGTNSDTYSSSSFTNGDVLTCIMTSSSNCVSPASITSNGITLTINPLPTVAANASSNPICDGDNLTLTGSGAETYLWDNSVIDGTAFNPTATNTYTVIGTDVNGCENTDQISVVVNNLPTVTYVESNTTLCLGETGVILTSGSPSGGTYSGPGVVGNTFDSNISGLGTHQITYSFTDGNGCTNTAISSILVEVCSGISENENELSVMVYPNPNTGNFTVYFPKDFNEEAVLKIFNNIGQEIFIEQITKGTTLTTVNLENISRGIYLMTITAKDKKSTAKIIKD